MTRLFLLLVCMGQITRADLRSVSTENLLLLRQEAQRRLELLQSETEVRKELIHTLKVITEGKPPSVNKVGWAHELNALRTKLKNLKQFQVLDSDEFCQSLLSQLHQGLNLSYEILRDEVSQSYYLSSSKLFERTQLEILVYQNMMWAQLIESQSEKGSSPLLPQIKRACQIENRTEFETLIVALADQISDLFFNLYGIPGYLNQYDFLIHTNEDVIDFYESDRNVLIGTSFIFGLGVPRLLMTLYKFNTLGKVVSLGVMSSGAYMGYSIGRDYASAQMSEVVVPGQEDVQSMLNVLSFVVEADKLSFVDLREILSSYYDKIVQEKSQMKQKMESVMKLVDSYIEKHGSAHAATEYLQYRIREIDLEIAAR